MPTYLLVSGGFTIPYHNIIYVPIPNISIQILCTRLRNNFPIKSRYSLLRIQESTIRARNKFYAQMHSFIRIHYTILDTCYCKRYLKTSFSSVNGWLLQHLKPQIKIAHYHNHTVLKTSNSGFVETLPMIIIIF